MKSQSRLESMPKPQMDWVKTKLRPKFANEQKMKNDLRGQQMATNVKSIKKTIQYYWDALSSFQFFLVHSHSFLLFFFRFFTQWRPVFVYSDHSFIKLNA